MPTQRMYLCTLPDLDSSDGTPPTPGTKNTEGVILLLIFAALKNNFDLCHVATFKAVIICFVFTHAISYLATLFFLKVVDKFCAFEIG